MKNNQQNFPFLQNLIRLISSQIFRRKKNIIGRTACLGSDLFTLRYPRKYGFRLINQQKVRVDLWLAWLSKESIPRPELIKPYMSRQDVFPLIENQAKLPWLVQSKFEYLLMDSFSELTDQKFTHRKEGWSFCCHYSDLEHTADFEKEFECHGLLPLEAIETAYTQFFDWFEREHPGKNVIFVHFPTTLDHRILYKQRGAEIHRAITKIQATKGFIQSLLVDDKNIEANENDNFPYHFSKSTNLAFVNSWNKLSRCKY